MIVIRKQRNCSECSKVLSKVKWVIVHDGNAFGHLEFCSRKCNSKYFSKLFPTKQEKETKP